MVKVKMLRDGLCKGFGEPARARREGEVVEFPDRYAAWLIDIGRAEEYVEPEPEPKPKPKAKPQAKRRTYRKRKTEKRSG